MELGDVIFDFRFERVREIYEKIASWRRAS